MSTLRLVDRDYARLQGSHFRQIYAIHNPTCAIRTTALAILQSAGRFSKPPATFGVQDRPDLTNVAIAIFCTVRVPRSDDVIRMVCEDSRRSPSRALPLAVRHHPGP